MDWLWIPITLVAAAAQTVRNAVQRSVTKTAGVLPAAFIRFFYGLPFAILFLALLAWRSSEPLPSATLPFVAWITVGAIGQVIATDHPDRLRSLVLSATWAGPDAYFRRLFESRKQTLLDSGIEAYLRLSALVQATPRWVSENDEFITELHRVAAAGYPPVEIVASRIDAILGHDRRRRLLQIRVPTLVIVARDDMITPSFYSEELASAIPGAKLVVLDGGGHFAPAIQATPYNAAVGAFLRALR